MKFEKITEESEILKRKKGRKIMYFFNNRKIGRKVKIFLKYCTTFKKKVKKMESRG